jgi:hypothetical protein
VNAADESEADYENWHICDYHQCYLEPSYAGSALVSLRGPDGITFAILAPPPGRLSMLVH